MPIWFSRIVQNVPRAIYTILIHAFNFQDTCRQINVLKMPSQLGFYILLHIVTRRQSCIIYIYIRTVMKTTILQLVAIYNIQLHLSQYLPNLMHNICFTISFISRLYIFRAHVLIIRRPKLYYTASDIITLIGVMISEAVQFWPPDDEHMCSKHVRGTK